VPAGAPPGRSIVTRRAVVDLVRTATLGSYGVTGFSDPNIVARILGWLRLAPAGIRVRLVPRLEIDLWLTVAWGLPVAEVARQVDSAVRYALRRALDRDVDSLLIHVNRLRILPGSGAAAAPTPTPTPTPDQTQPPDATATR
jgi:uncharacterized alkaline shock family protein YloU